MIKLIANAYEVAEREGNAIPCIKPSDSLRMVKGQENKIIDREEIVMIQTPQTFEISQLRKGYQQNYTPKFTDDASVVEAAGFPINLIEGERKNIKITYPEDLELANSLLKL